MANEHRGEIEAEFDGKRYRLCLTLGALAELENAFGENDMLAVAERFESGRITARDTIRILGAGLRGAGYDIDDATISAMRVAGGATGFVEIVARLLAATFGTATQDGADGEGAPVPGGKSPAPRCRGWRGDGLAATPAPIDWPWLMGLGLGVLRMPPIQFWTMTPRELAAATKVVFGDPIAHAPFGRDDFAALMARYPDQADKGKHD